MRDNTIPLTLISILADGEFHSGEQLGERLGMSRAGELMCSPSQEKVTACQSRSSY